MAMIDSSPISFQITKTWDNNSIPLADNVLMILTYDNDKNDDGDLMIDVRAKFYDDPHLPDWRANPKTFDKLWDYEVVELFLLNDKTDNYLEIELSPKGQYLLLELNGYRNVTRSGIELKSYHTDIIENQNLWIGKAIVSGEDLPKGINKFNAYAIHGTDPNRKYLSLFPVPKNDSRYSEPDFHRLEFFQSISIFNNKNDQQPPKNNYDEVDCN